jgi:Non-classical export protein 1
MVPVLLSRYMHFQLTHFLSNGLCSGLDPLLGVFTGILAYYMYETNPRTAPPADQKLGELARWKLSKWKHERDERLARLEAGG